MSKPTQKELYEWAYEYLLKDREPAYVTSVGNKRSRQCTEHARATIKFSEDSKNLEELTACGEKFKLNKIAAATDDPKDQDQEFSLINNKK